jgi:hypothetical protein
MLYCIHLKHFVKTSVKIIQGYCAHLLKKENERDHIICNKRPNMEDTIISKAVRVEMLQCLKQQALVVMFVIRPFYFITYQAIIEIEHFTDGS